jgi:hypothetical protein
MKCYGHTNYYNFGQKGLNSTVYPSLALSWISFCHIWYIIASVSLLFTGSRNAKKNLVPMNKEMLTTDDLAEYLSIAAAQLLNLDFVPLANERFDLIIANECCPTEVVNSLCKSLGTDDFKSSITHLGG